MIEQLLPGSAEYGRGLDASIAETHRRLMADAVDDLATALQARDAMHELADHWTALGGRIPQD